MEGIVLFAGTGDCERQRWAVGTNRGREVGNEGYSNESEEKSEEMRKSNRAVEVENGKGGLLVIDKREVLDLVDDQGLEAVVEDG